MTPSTIALALIIALATPLSGPIFPHEILLALPLLGGIIHLGRPLDCHFRKGVVLIVGLAVAPFFNLSTVTFLFLVSLTAETLLNVLLSTFGLIGWHFLNPWVPTLAPSLGLLLLGTLLQTPRIYHARA